VDRLLREALALDPSYAPAASLLAESLSFQKANGWEVLSDQQIDEAAALARQAADNAKDDPQVLSTAGWAIAYFTGDHAVGLSLIERGLTLNSNSALSWEARGYVSYSQTFLTEP
jgi:adenylate cyclase